MFEIVRTVLRLVFLAVDMAQSMSDRNPKARWYTVYRIYL